MYSKPFGDFKGIVHMSLDAQGKGFKALQQEGGADALQAESDLRHLLEEVLLEISQQ